MGRAKKTTPSHETSGYAANPSHENSASDVSRESTRLLEGIEAPLPGGSAHLVTQHTLSQIFEMEATAQVATVTKGECFELNKLTNILRRRYPSSHTLIFCKFKFTVTLTAESITDIDVVAEKPTVGSESQSKPGNKSDPSIREVNNEKITEEKDTETAEAQKREYLTMKV